MGLFDIVRSIGAKGFGRLASTPSTWTADRAAKHTKLVHSERVQRQWVKVATETFERTRKVDEAIRVANGTVRKTVSNDLTRSIARDSSQRRIFLKQQGFVDGKLPKGYHVDHKEPLCHGGKDIPTNMQLLKYPEHLEKTREDMLKLKDLKMRTGVTQRNPRNC